MKSKKKLVSINKILYNKNKKEGKKMKKRRTTDESPGNVREQAILYKVKRKTKRSNSNSISSNNFILL